MLDFLGIGAQRTGTTWLHYTLQKHPQLVLPFHKEIHFWDADHASSTWKRDLAWYLGLFQGHGPAVRCGEITPSYALLPVDVIRRIRDAKADLRILFTVRNPIDRAVSHALMQFCKIEGRAVDSLSKEEVLAHCLSQKSRERGDYAACLERWFGVFAPENFFIEEFDAMRADNRGYLRKLFRFLDVDPSPASTWSTDEITDLRNVMPPYRISSPARGMLRGLYAEPVARLSKLLDRDFSAWLA